MIPPEAADNDNDHDNNPELGSDDPQKPAINFYYHHLFRGICPDDMHSKVLFSIPYSLIEEVILEHNKIQNQVDGFTERPPESQEETIRSYKENGGDVEHNRKRRKVLLSLESDSDSEIG